MDCIKKYYHSKFPKTPEEKQTINSNIYESQPHKSMNRLSNAPQKHPQSFKNFNTMEEEQAARAPNSHDVRHPCFNNAPQKHPQSFKNYNAMEEEHQEQGRRAPNPHDARQASFNNAPPTYHPRTSNNFDFIQEEQERRASNPYDTRQIHGCQRQMTTKLTKSTVMLQLERKSELFKRVMNAFNRLIENKDPQAKFKLVSTLNAASMGFKAIDMILKADPDTTPEVQNQLEEFKEDFRRYQPKLTVDEKLVKGFEDILYDNGYQFMQFDEVIEEAPQEVTYQTLDFYMQELNEERKRAQRIEADPEKNYIKDYKNHNLKDEDLNNYIR